MRAARALNASLELGDVLRTLAREAALAVDGDITGVYLGNAETGGVATAGHNVADGWHGLTLAAGEGAAGQALRHGPRRSRPTTTTATTRLPAHETLRRSAPPSPSRWPGTTSSRARCRSAGRRCGGSRPRTCARSRRSPTSPPSPAATPRPTRRSSTAARTDALTGLLNHGAMQVRLREEIARARRDGRAAGLRDPRPRRLQARQRRRAATRPATSCCAASPTCCGPSCGPTTRSPATAATSSCCCCPAATRRSPAQVAERVRDAVAAEAEPGSRLRAGRRLLARRRPVARAAGRRRAARARRPRAAARQAHRQGPRRRRQRRRRARARAAARRSRLPRRRAGARRRDRGARPLHARATPTQVVHLAARRRDDPRPARPPRSSGSPTRRCCTTSASSPSRTRSCTSAAR